MSADQSRASSIHFVLRWMWATRASYLAVYASPDAMYPCGAERYRYLPHGVMKVVKCLSDSASATEW